MVMASSAWGRLMRLMGTFEGPSDGGVLHSALTAPRINRLAVSVVICSTAPAIAVIPSTPFP